MRKYLVGLFILLCLTLLNIDHSHHVHAAEHKLEDLHIDVKIQEDGSAIITETRTATLSEGTENFLVIENLGRSTIRDFIVEENGERYDYIENWNLDASREEKAFKNSLIQTKAGYELSWGIGEYGNHEYIVQYEITNFIKQLNDGQIIFWRFVNDQTNIPPEKLTVEISADQSFTDKDEQIWAFGYPGDVYFSNGKVVATNDKPLTKKDYVTILMRLPESSFATEDVINENFETIQDKAFEGSDYGKENASDESFFSKLIRLVKNIFITIVIGAVIILTLMQKITSKNKSTKIKRRKFARRYKEEYYRDYPYEGNYLNTHYIAYTMGLSNFTSILTSLLLKWIKEERIRIDESETSGFFNKNKTVITIYILQQNDDEDNSLEGSLFRMLKNAANAEGVLTEDKMEKWAERNNRPLAKWQSRILTRSVRALEEEDYLISSEKKVLFSKKKLYELSHAGEELEKHMYQYVNYLHDYSLLNEHDAVNVKLWDDMMIWAAYLGLTSVVMEQFKQLYPKYTEESIYKERTLNRTRRLAQRTEKGRALAARNRSKGKGGRTSRGGGGGSYGGGSGGGTR